MTESTESWCKRFGGNFRDNKDGTTTCTMPGEFPFPKKYFKVFEESGGLGNPPILSSVKYFHKEKDADRWFEALKDAVKDEEEGMGYDAVVMENERFETGRWVKGED